MFNSCWNPNRKAVKRCGVIHLWQVRKMSQRPVPTAGTELGYTYSVSTHELLDVRHIITDQL